jgi:hypothetical protein
MREAGGRIVLMDLGLGMVVGTGEIGVGEVVGTPLCMAPETFLRGDSSPQSDIYSLGVLLYHLVTGRFPVEARGLEELRAAHQSSKRQLLGDLRPELPRSFVGVVEKALASEPEERFSTSGAMEKALSESIGMARTRPAGQRKSLGKLMPGIVGIAFLAAVLIFGATRLPWGGGHYSVRAGLYRATVGGSTELLRDGDLVEVGDRLFMEFEASRRLYVYVISQDDKGRAFVHFPLPGFDTANPLPSDGPHKLPGTFRGKLQGWEITTPGGTEHFLIIASPEKLPELEEELALLELPSVEGQLTAHTLSQRSIERIRGIGGLGELRTSDDANTAGALDRLFEVVARMENKEESTRGVWVRRIELRNPEVE